jgi:hypothetical protein
MMAITLLVLYSENGEETFEFPPLAMDEQRLWAPTRHSDNVNVPKQQYCE